MIPKELAQVELAGGKEALLKSQRRALRGECPGKAGVWRTEGEVGGVARPRPGDAWLRHLDLAFHARLPSVLSPRGTAQGSHSSARTREGPLATLQPGRPRSGARTTGRRSGGHVKPRCGRSCRESGVMTAAPRAGGLGAEGSRGNGPEEAPRSPGTAATPGPTLSRLASGLMLVAPAGTEDSL